ncbi:hypothetical protein FS749_001962 [Ceratobasidium sp. UAMH 11750]|nr:hypothetical protein FS749_001962 [Ceratobasidium sp. UAMH 11750]
MNPTIQATLENARRAPYYLGHDDLAEHVTWVHTADDNVEVVVPNSTTSKTPDATVLPARLNGIFQISPNGWYLDPDMGMNVAQPAKWQADKGLEASFADG